jgi:hypothetical protein
MDRVYLAIIASALLLLLGATSLYVTRTADLMSARPHGRHRQMMDQDEALATHARSGPAELARLERQGGTNFEPALVRRAECDRD